MMLLENINLAHEITQGQITESENIGTYRKDLKC